MTEVETFQRRCTSCGRPDVHESPDEARQVLSTEERLAILAELRRAVRCERCIVLRRIEHARKMVEALPHLERRLAELTVPS